MLSGCGLGLLLLALAVPLGLDGGSLGVDLLGRGFVVGCLGPGLLDSAGLRAVVVRATGVFAALSVDTGRAGDMPARGVPAMDCLGPLAARAGAI